MEKLTITVKLHITDPDYLTDVRNIGEDIIADDFRESIEKVKVFAGYDFEVTAKKKMEIRYTGDFAEDRKTIMRQWDSWRAYIAQGGESSWPRDAFEALLDYFDERLRIWE